MMRSSRVTEVANKAPWCRGAAVRSLIVATAILGSAACRRAQPAPSVDPAAASAADAHCATARAKGRTEEARQWLQSATTASPRTVGEHDPPSTKEIVADLYARGAVRAEVAEIRSTGAGEWSNVVLVTLPDDAKLRAQVFAFGVDYQSEFDPAEDVGQHCLFLFKFKGRLVRRFGQK